MSVPSRAKQSRPVSKIRLLVLLLDSDKNVRPASTVTLEQTVEVDPDINN